MPQQNLVAGIILAAGQSKRMQWPSALLSFSGGQTLLEAQVDLFASSPCDPIVVVTGAHTTLTREKLPKLKVTWGHNERWQGGTFTSLQIGLRLALTITTITGSLILPIDVVGVSGTTIRNLIDTAKNNPKVAVILPEYDGKSGSPIYLSRAFMEKMIAIGTDSPEANLDYYIGKERSTIRLPVADRRIGINVNTRQEWQQYLDSLRA